MNVSASLYSANIVDVYGSGIVESKVILNKYSKQVSNVQSDIEFEFYKEYVKGFTSDKKHIDNINKNFENKKALVDKIKKEGGFLFVDFETVVYPGQKNMYTTIEIIEKTKPNRLKFISQGINSKPSLNKSDLIGKMMNYSWIGRELLQNNQLDLNDNACPVYHCTNGFNHNKLKPFLNVFNTGVVKEKSLILDTLNHDADPARRAAAAYLVGHFHDPNEINPGA